MDRVVCLRSRRPLSPWGRGSGCVRALRDNSCGDRWSLTSRGSAAVSLSDGAVTRTEFNLAQSEVPVRAQVAVAARHVRNASSRRARSAGICGLCSSTAPCVGISLGSSNDPDSASVGSRSITPCRSLRRPLPRPRGKGSNMGQFSAEKPAAPGSVLSGNQHLRPDRDRSEGASALAADDFASRFAVPCHRRIEADHCLKINPE